jgi:hypothetical protein
VNVWYDSVPESADCVAAVAAFGVALSNAPIVRSRSFQTTSVYVPATVGVKVTVPSAVEVVTAAMASLAKV